MSEHHQENEQINVTVAVFFIVVLVGIFILGLFNNHV